MFLTWKRHRFLHLRFALFTMFISNKIFLCVPCVLSVLLRFFLTFLLIRRLIFIITTLSFSIRDRYTIRIYNWFKWFLNFIFFFFFLLRGLPLSSPCWKSCSILLGCPSGYKGSSV